MPFPFIFNSFISNLGFSSFLCKKYHTAHYYGHSLPKLVKLIVQNYCFAIKYIEINIKILKANGEEAQGKRFYGDRYLLLKFIKSVNSNFRAF